MKTKWIIIRGLGRGHGHWGSFIETFERAFPDDHFYWVDMPGTGFLNQIKTPLTIEKFIPHMEDQLKKTDFHSTSGQTLGLGLSLGGMVLVEWAKTRNFEKLFLINTSSARFSKPWERISLDVVMNTFKQLRAKELAQIEMNSLLVTTNLTEEKIRKDYNKSYEAIIAFTKNIQYRK